MTGKRKEDQVIHSKNWSRKTYDGKKNSSSMYTYVAFRSWNDYLISCELTPLICPCSSRRRLRFTSRSAASVCYHLSVPSSMNVGRSRLASMWRTLTHRDRWWCSCALWTKGDQTSRAAGGGGSSAICRVIFGASSCDGFGPQQHSTHLVENETQNNPMQ